MRGVNWSADSIALRINLRFSKPHTDTLYKNQQYIKGFNMKQYKYFSDLKIGETFKLNGVYCIKNSSRTLRLKDNNRIFYAGYWDVVETINNSSN